MTPEWAVAVALAGLALGASFVNGLLGAGGAVMLVPLALYALPYLAGTSLGPHQVSGLVLVQSVASAAGGGLSFHRRGQVNRGALLRGGWLLAIGGLGGALASAPLPGRVLLLAFALATSGAALLLLARPPGPLGPPLRGRRLLAGGCYLGIGLLGGAIGIGAGFLVIPVLVYLLGSDQRLASGTGLVLTVFLTLPALLGKAVTGQVLWLPAGLMFLTALVGSVAGSRLNRLLPGPALRRALGLVVAVLALRVWMDLAGPLH